VDTEHGERHVHAGSLVFDNPEWWSVASC
jgi:hypothetical protein